MTPLLLIVMAFGSALALCLLLTPLVRAAALRWGLVDKPDGRRKIHTHPIPVAGGVAVLLTTAVVLTALFGSVNAPEADLGGRWLKMTGLAIAALIIAAVGVLDDYRGMRAWPKFLGQLLAVIVVMACGVQVHTLRVFDMPLELGVIGYLFTAFWLLGAINSLNLIDGLDGLLGSLGGIICGSLAVLAYFNGQYQVGIVAAALAGSVLGFLCFNFPPATIFLGDCGSMLIGLVVGVLAIESSLKGPATAALAVPAALLVIPIFDTSAAIIRRKLTGRSIYTTDRGHLHHVLMRRGLSNGRVIALVGGLSLLASAGAVFSLVAHNEVWALLSVLIVMVLLVVTGLFGQAEFLLIKQRLLAAAAALRHGNEQGWIHQTEVRLQGSVDWNELWKNVTTCAERLRLMSVCLDVNAPALHEGYHARWGRGQGDGENPSYWRAEVPLAAHGQVIGRLEMTGARDRGPVWDQILLMGKIVDDLELAMTGLTTPPPPPSLDTASAPEPVGLEPVPTVESPAPAPRRAFLSRGRGGRRGGNVP